ncbi:hypothetical protein [Bifidobacterium biavatii]|uniref:2CS histidine protein kinase n=1 Tax=Bifidobacterium biavatii DSM 23969 TaxID=1437608 RepID=A0A087A5A6_9BIFI|nr:hypothetical protein [Bifidobacterium biavatii]KFI53956.1 2CS histidine protein kinase [Bifidobacterium biavatii DSM 23969]
MTATVEWRERLVAADRRVANAWLLVAVLVVSLVCTMETLVALVFDGMTVASVVCAFVFAAAVIGMAFRPVSGGLTVVTLWTVLCFAPVTMPSATLVAVLIAVAVFGYANRRAAVAIAVIALASWLLTAGGVAVPQWGSGNGSGSANSLTGSDTSSDSGGDSADSSDSDTDDSAGSGNDDAPANDSIGNDAVGESAASGNGTGSGQTDDADSGNVSGGSQNGNDSGQSSGADGPGQSGQSSQSENGDNAASDDAGSDNDRHVLLGTVAMVGVAPVVILFAGFLLGGMAARWNHERHTAQMELEYRRQRARAAQDIHDYVSNDLAYLILRFDKDIADGRAPSLAELRELRDVASGALDRTHQVIGVIEGRDGGDPRASSTVERLSDHGHAAATSASSHPSVINPSVDRADCPLAAQLRTIARSGDHRLAELGFDGQTIVSNANDAAQPDDLFAGLLEELYGNIAKHADPDGGYVLTIGVGRDAVQIALVDTALAKAEVGHHADGAARIGDGGRERQSLGTGLKRYQATIAERGGTMHVETGWQSDPQSGEWTLSATIPL